MCKEAHDEYIVGLPLFESGTDARAREGAEDILHKLGLLAVTRAWPKPGRQFRAPGSWHEDWRIGRFVRPVVMAYPRDRPTLPTRIVHPPVDRLQRLDMVGYRPPAAQRKFVLDIDDKCLHVTALLQYLSNSMRYAYDVVRENMQYG